MEWHFINIIAAAAVAKSLQSCLTLWDPMDCSLRPWDFPGRSTGVGCPCLLHLELHMAIILDKNNPGNSNLTDYFIFFMGLFCFGIWYYGLWTLLPMFLKKLNIFSLPFYQGLENLCPSLIKATFSACVLNILILKHTRIRPILLRLVLTLS